MARAAMDVVGRRVEDGVVVCPHGSAPALTSLGLRWIEAGHPLPDDGSLVAGEQVEALLEKTHAGDVVLALVSGGGSSLVESLPPGVTLRDIRRLTGLLQRVGAPVTDLNRVRAALSPLKGGGLASMARPARVLSLILSDVPGDAPEVIASGPTVLPRPPRREALEVLDRYGVAAEVPAVREELRRPLPRRPRVAAPGDGWCIVASNRSALDAAALEARRRGFRALVLGDQAQGEAREVGRLLGALGRSIRRSAIPLPPPACLLLGGETTVTVRGRGRGGRNQELALGAALALEGCPRTALLSFATDGIDGPTAAAGARVTGETVARARALGLSPRRALARNDTEPFFRSMGDLWVTGPTGTNVSDVTVVLVYE